MNWRDTSLSWPYMHAYIHGIHTRNDRVCMHTYTVFIPVMTVYVCIHDWRGYRRMHTSHDRVSMLTRGVLYTFVTFLWG